MDGTLIYCRLATSGSGTIAFLPTALTKTQILENEGCNYQLHLVLLFLV